MSKLHVLLLTEEDRLYLPLSIQHILETCQHSIDHVCCLRNPLTESLPKTASRFLSAFGPVPLAKHALRIVGPAILDRVPILNRTGRYYSVRRTVEALGRHYHWVENVNSRAFVHWVEELNPDLIVSVSPTQIFKERLLAIPRLGSLNVHTSLLPAHRGLYPVYWAMAGGDDEVGVSVHYLEEDIDSGDIVLQRTVSLEGVKTLHEMLVTTKRLGARLMVEAIDLAAEGNLSRAPVDIEQGTYHSFPDRESYRRFRGHGYSLW